MKRNCLFSRLTPPINKVRSDISDQCLRAGSRKTGIYRLDVPTGGGKTLSAMRFALEHGLLNGKKRMIFIIPLLSVLDQNAKDIKKYASDEALVLEHHSNVINEPEDNKENEDQDKGYSYASVSWNEEPIIVSTMVQLLNILFKAKTSSVERMQALTDSVIVIDEVQSLPRKVTAMFNMAINFLSEICNATVILSSATQPCFDDVEWPIKFSEDTEIVKLSGEQRKVFERAEIIDKTDKYGIDMEQLSDFCKNIMEDRRTLLVICNTKNEARELFEKLAEKNEYDWKMFHLSTSMCQAHRAIVMDELREELKKAQTLQDKKVVCISTQIAEAGVDLSFDTVVRLEAGIDNLAQATGRCNRSGEYSYGGKVYLVNLKNEQLRMLKDIQIAKDCTEQVIYGLKDRKNGIVIDDVSVNEFYKHLFNETKKDLFYRYDDGYDEVSLADMLANKKTGGYKKESDAFVLHQPFKTVGRIFKVFEENTEDVIVPFDKGVEIIRELRALDTGYTDIKKLKEVVRKAKPYTIQVFEYQKKILFESGYLETMMDNNILVLSEEAYDRSCGLNVSKEKSVEEYII